MAIRSAVAAALCALCALTAAREPPAENVLFVGNSLTLANGLPALVEAVARASGTPVRAAVVAFPGYSLEDHWNRGDASRAIARGGWRFVVLQQGPSALPQSRVLLLEYGRRFDALIRSAGGRTAFYMIWPEARHRADYPDVSASYGAAAEAVGAVLLPVGDAWRAAWQLDPKLPLYASDQFHPSPLGSALGALVIFEHLFAKSATVPREWTLSAGERDTIRSAAAAVSASSH